MSDPLAPLIGALHAEGRLRIWSLAITVFGDSLQHRGGTVTSARLQTLLGRIGIGKGALRTALSRLGADGWIAAERQGRQSLYRLTPRAEAETHRAAARIYAAPRRDPVAEWRLTDRPAADSVALHGLYLAPADGPAPDAPGFEMTGRIETLLHALRDSLVAPDHAAALRALDADLGALDAAGQGALPPLDAAAARTLLIHRWRRLILRFPDLPAEILMRDPRAGVATAYAALSPAAEAWLDAPDGNGPPLPPRDAAWSDRFGGLQTP